ncbi:HlyD family secretion protein [Acetobacteraceae bacterium H6797]|nr:HlyD family secretion protein [Acetobacteraceae bacterium H6797]
MKIATHLLRSIVIVCIGILGAGIVLWAWQLPPFDRGAETTDNAYVRGQVTTISPQLAGYVTEVAVQDFQVVKQGQLLVKIDDRIYEQRVRQAEAALATQKANLDNLEQTRRSAEARIPSAEAQVESAKTALATAEASEHRVEALLSRGISTQSAADQARSSVAQARSTLQQAETALAVAQQDLASITVNRRSLEAAVQNADAALRLAQIDLQNTRILAPRDGKLGEIGVRLGQYVAAGTQLAALVPDRVWVVANFKENQINGMYIGQPVSFTVDALNHARLTGRIEEFSPATGSEFSVIKADNATGNFTKVAQRLPVRIAIDPDQPLAHDIVPGLSVVVSVRPEVGRGDAAAAETGWGHSVPAR